MIPWGDVTRTFPDDCGEGMTFLCCQILAKISYFVAVGWPNLAADGAGRIGLSFYAGSGPANASADRWFVSSLNGARAGSWGLPVRLSGPRPAAVRSGNDRNLGDYQDLTAIPPGEIHGFRGNFFDASANHNVAANGLATSTSVNVTGVIVQ